MNHQFLLYMIRHINSLHWQFTLNGALQLRSTCGRTRQIIPRCIATLITGIKFLLAARYAIDIINEDAVPTIYNDIDINSKRYYSAEAASYTYRWVVDLSFGIVHLIYGYIHGVRKYTDGDYVSFHKGIEHGYRFYDGIYSIMCDDRMIYSRHIK